MDEVNISKDKCVSENLFSVKQNGKMDFSATCLSDLQPEKEWNRRLIRERERNKRRLKMYKANDGLDRFEFGIYVNLDRVEMLSICALVERVEYAKLNKGDLQAWVNKFWVSEMGYAPNINQLVNG